MVLRMSVFFTAELKATNYQGHDANETNHGLSDDESDHLSSSTMSEIQMPGPSSSYLGSIDWNANDSHGPPREVLGVPVWSRLCLM